MYSRYVRLMTHYERKRNHCNTLYRQAKGEKKSCINWHRKNPLKNSTPFIIKGSPQTRKRGASSTSWRTPTKNLTANNILNGEWLNTSELGKRQGCPFSSLCKARKRNKKHPSWKRRNKTALILDDMIVYKENPKKSRSS